MKIKLLAFLLVCILLMTCFSGCTDQQNTKTGTDSDEGGTDSDDDDDDEKTGDDENTSAVYWFKANLNFYDFKDLRLTDTDHDDRYTVGVSAYWDPVPYVQYYQIRFEFHGNTPEDYASSCDFRDQGTSGCDPHYVSISENYIYQLGGDPENEGYMRPFDGPNVAMIHKKNHSTGEMDDIVIGQLYPDGKHGFGFWVVGDTIDDWEDLSDTAIESIVNEMQTFVKDYVDGWEIWVRGVTETES
jgi:hypothetical protein